MNLTIRARLTLMFGALFLVASALVLLGAGLLGERSFDRSAAVDRPDSQAEAKVEGSGGPDLAPQATRESQQVIESVRDDVIDSQRRITLVAIGVMGAVAFGLCWWLSGRALRPVHRITGTASRLSLSNLDERIGLTGPRDELKELADTFDAMLDRLARAADDQRRFVANASHELRTPLAVQRAAIEIGLASPSPERLAAIRTELLRTTERSSRLIDGLLALAQGEDGPVTRTPVDLAAAVHQSAGLYATDEIELALDLRPVTVDGDEVLLGRLVDNLMENAVRYNHPGGRVDVRLAPDTGLLISNTGPVVPADRVAELFQPFRRLGPDRTSGAGGASATEGASATGGASAADGVSGAGLGLSIVAATARAHNLEVTAVPNPGGGLTVRVSPISAP